MSLNSNNGKRALHTDLVAYVSKSFNIPHNFTNKILSTYISLQRNILLSGNSIHFSDFASIKISNKPNDEEYMYSTALLGTVISKELNIPVFTSIQVIRKYLDVIKTCVNSGYSTGIKSLIRVLPIEVNGDSNEVINVRSYVPTPFLTELKENGIVARGSVRNLRESLNFSEETQVQEKEFIDFIGKSPSQFHEQDLVDEDEFNDFLELSSLNTKLSMKGVIR